MDAHLLSYDCDFHPRYSYIALDFMYTTCILWHLLAFQKVNMDPRTFLAPIPCNLCNLLLYTLRDVSQHCAQHGMIHFICHHCLTHFDSKGAIAAHMNQKGAHLRQSFDFGTYTSAMPSPSPAAVLPISHGVSADSDFVRVFADPYGRFLGQCFSGSVVTGH